MLVCAQGMFVTRETVEISCYHTLHASRVGGHHEEYIHRDLHHEEHIHRDLRFASHHNNLCLFVPRETVRNCRDQFLSHAPRPTPAGSMSRVGLTRSTPEGSADIGYDLMDVGI